MLNADSYIRVYGYEYREKSLVVGCYGKAYSYLSH